VEHGHDQCRSIKPRRGKALWASARRNLPALEGALKDDDQLLDDVIKATYDRLIRRDPVRAEQMMTLIIRRHRDGRKALKDMFTQRSRTELATA
jgi:hypothetical protein